MDLVIRGGTVVTATGAYQADIGIEGGHIATIGRRLNASRVLDATDMYVIPGAIDAHVHMELPLGPVTSSDTFTTGTIAAACGGTTTVIDFCQSARRHSLRDTMAERRGVADGQVAIDYGLHVAVLDAEPSTLSEIGDLVALGCPSFKLYMAYEGSWLDDGEIWAILTTVATHGGLAIVHCENHQTIQRLNARFRAGGHLEPRFHPLSHPATMEGEATGRLIDIARITHCPAYIVHVSCREAMSRIQVARGGGQAIYGETCPQYLLLAEQEYLRPGFQGAKYVMSPPLRTAADHNALWQALGRGDLQVVSTDHCPFFYDGQKTLGLEDYTMIPGGIPGVETRLALVHHYGVGMRRMSLQQWVATCCTNPARLFGMAPRKGDVAVGSDADLVVFDPFRRVTLQARHLHQHTDYCPYEGTEVVGFPQHTISRGEIVVEDGEFVGESGHGRFVMRSRPELPPVG